jgi:type III pantothenate kinase
MNHARRILAVDIGNTRAKFGCFEQHEHTLPRAAEIVARVVSAEVSLADELKAWWSLVSHRDPQVSVIAASDPESRDALVANWPFEKRPEIISGYKQVPIQVDVEFPDRVGIDRLLNVFAAQQLQTQPAPVIVVDSGTATTVDLMTSDGRFRGGSILPGLRLSAYAMHDYTARLPLLNVDEEPTELPSVPGRNTEEAMRAGLFIGQLGAVKELISRLADASNGCFQQHSPPGIVISGGGGRQLVRHIPGATLIDSLALHGLAFLVARL